MSLGGQYGKAAIPAANTVSAFEFLSRFPNEEIARKHIEQRPPEKAFPAFSWPRSLASDKDQRGICFSVFVKPWAVTTMMPMAALDPGWISSDKNDFILLLLLDCPTIRDQL